MQNEPMPVRILFHFYSNVLDEWTNETLWANKVPGSDNHYTIDNIPFFAPVTIGDIVFATYNALEDYMVYRETIIPSGNSTVQVLIQDTNTEINEIRERLKNLGCPSEKLNAHYFVLVIPAEKDYRPIRSALLELEKAGIISYAEPCLSKNHWYD